MKNRIPPFSFWVVCCFNHFMTDVSAGVLDCFLVLLPWGLAQCNPFPERKEIPLFQCLIWASLLAICYLIQSSSYCFIGREIDIGREILVGSFANEEIEAQRTKKICLSFVAHFHREIRHLKLLSSCLSWHKTHSVRDICNMWFHWRSRDQTQISRKRLLFGGTAPQKTDPIKKSVFWLSRKIWI